jgi:hypothetical protein
MPDMILLIICSILKKFLEHDKFFEMNNTMQDISLSDVGSAHYITSDQVIQENLFKVESLRTGYIFTLTKCPHYTKLQNKKKLNHITWHIPVCEQKLAALALVSR